MSILLDTGFLYATLNRNEPQHPITRKVLSTLQPEILLPIPVITEVTYLIKRVLV